MPIAPALRLGSAALIVLLGAGLIVYGVAGKRPAGRDDCHETILDPDPDQSGGHTGTLHLLTCPDEQRTGYWLQLTDYWRTPPVIEWLFAGSMTTGPGAPVVPVRSHWVTPDSLILEYHPGLRMSHRLDTAGPVHLAWVPLSTAH